MVGGEGEAADTQREASVAATIKAAAAEAARLGSIQRSTATTSATMIAPRVGGRKKLGANDYFWTGG
jgi:hypothetical protein